MVHELVKNFVDERIQFCSIIERVDAKDLNNFDVVKFEAGLKTLRAIKSEIDTIGVISIENRKWLVDFVGGCLSLNIKQQKIMGSFFPENPSGLERHTETQARLINDEQLFKVIMIHI